MLKLLLITAHPDDEAAGFGGSLLLYAERGVETYIVCMTPGQAASHRGNAASDDDLAALRRQEFAASCRILNVSHAEVLDFHDGKLDRADFYAAVGELVRRIRTIRPHVILTFGTEGAITAHPDHSMAAMFATMAYHWAARTDRYVEQLDGGLRPHQAQKLYYSTAPFTLADRPQVALAPATTTIAIGPYQERKIAAFKAHTTQSPLFQRVETAVRRRGQLELFHLALRSKPSTANMETDLFDGVKENSGT